MNKRQEKAAAAQDAAEYDYLAYLRLCKSLKDCKHTSDKDAEVATSEEIRVVSREQLPGNEILNGFLEDLRNFGHLRLI